MTTPVSPSDPINDAILRVSEDQLAGFQRDPLRAISERTGIDLDTVITRISAMLSAGTIRRVRQTLLATNLAQGALVAWKLDAEDLDAAFDWLLENDPFTGHIVIRTSETKTRGSDYRLWTTLKVPKGFSIEHHCEILATIIGAEKFRIMPALRSFVLGVGHLRRRGLEPGARASEPAEAREAAVVDLDENEWRVLMALKRELAPQELTLSL
ncbi:MAG TPA: Lrp/AsnC family transcriptional regulator, partial [Thermoanaerobaculia bacterium]